MSFVTSILPFIIFLVITVLVGIIGIGPDKDSLKFWLYNLSMWIVSTGLFKLSLSRYRSPNSASVMMSSSAGMIVGSMVYMARNMFNTII